LSAPYRLPHAGATVSETLDNDPLTFKAIWGFNATEAPGAVYLAAAMAAHAQIGLPAYSYLRP